MDLTRLITEQRNPHTLAIDELATLDIDVVAYAVQGDVLREARQVLAGREGPIVRLVSEPIEAEAYALERATCVDTTAAGGNASLLAAAE